MTGRVKAWGMALVAERTTQGVLEGLDFETAEREAYQAVFGFDPDRPEPEPPSTHSFRMPNGDLITWE